MKLPVVKIQKFCLHDGSGIRTTVFLHGCPLNCKWCHNPETKSGSPLVLYDANRCIRCGACTVCPNGAHVLTEEGHRFLREKCTGCGLCTRTCVTGALESAFQEMSVEEILETVKQDQAFYGTDGGITLSGGEPMLHPKETIALLTAAKHAGLTTVVETCGYFRAELLRPLAEVTDTLLWDVKDMNPARHLQNTGVGNELILTNLRKMDQIGTSRLIMRCIMLQGINTDAESIRQLAMCFRSLKNCLRVELIPYHAMGGAKYCQLGLPEAQEKSWIPSRESLLTIQTQLEQLGVPVRIN